MPKEFHRINGMKTASTDYLQQLWCYKDDGVMIYEVEYESYVDKIISPVVVSIKSMKSLRQVKLMMIRMKDDKDRDVDKPGIKSDEEKSDERLRIQ